MDPFALPLIAQLLDAAYLLVESIAALLHPLAGGASAAIAVVVLTMTVRTLLIPVGISQVKAEWARRRLAPRLQALQRKYKKNPQLLQRKTMALHKAENVSPFAGILPTLLQAPVISLVYALFIRGTIGGHANALLASTIGGVPLGASLITTGINWPGIAVFAALLIVIAVVAWISRRIALRLALQPVDAPAAVRLNAVLSWLPFLTLVFAAVVPLAATLYLATTATWTLVERTILRRRYWGQV
ncbi:membrane protein insertase YidC [Salinibacterium sp.]|uniref:YidC/Oxa1 family membrane protein insertase n=1 Tax=Salinibacterium sp. TaxID=1915057 RepID=UPI00286A6CC9|nr:membrane protein insertase YidC [Salinibacterium sp.]